MSPVAKAAYHVSPPSKSSSSCLLLIRKQPFGAGARTCLGINVAQMEIRLATAEFFRECAGARLAPSTTPASMALDQFFLLSPAGHKCEVVLKT